MASEPTQAGTSVGYRSMNNHANVFTCQDFTEGECCQGCHQAGYVIAIYPWSVYSEGYKDKMPDLSMGLRGEVCCRKFHAVRQLSRAWWIRRYCAKQKWSEADTERLVQATPETYSRISGELASKYFPAFGGGAKSQRSSTPATRSAPRSKPTGSGCPSCGGKWDGVVCNNCGYA
jgi:hypothetical protein